MPNLLPVGYEDQSITDEDLAADRPIGYRNGIAFDDVNGDFLRDGRNRLLDSNGVESWKSWIVNGIQTQRYAHLAYSTDFGIEYDLVFAAKSHDEAESILVRQITEFIMADPYERCEFIESIDITWTAPDSIQVDVTAHGIDDVTIDVTAYITRQDA